MAAARGCRMMAIDQVIQRHRWDCAAAQAHHSAKHGKTFSSMAEVPGSLVDTQAVELERFTAAALFALAGSSRGVAVLVKHPDTVKGESHKPAALEAHTNIINAAGLHACACQDQAACPRRCKRWPGVVIYHHASAGLTEWAQSNDPILQRFGVGVLARIVVSDVAGADLVLKVDRFRSLVSTLESSIDPQAQCFGAAAIGEQKRTPSGCHSHKDGLLMIIQRSLFRQHVPGTLVKMDGRPYDAPLIKSGIVPALLAMLRPREPSDVRTRLAVFMCPPRVLILLSMADGSESLFVANAAIKTRGHARFPQDPASRVQVRTELHVQMRFPLPGAETGLCKGGHSG